MKLHFMRSFFIAIGLILSIGLDAQIIVTPSVPYIGTIQKSQLWNFTVTNTSTSVLDINVELMLIDRNSSMQILSASTAVIQLLPGSTTQLSHLMLQPIQYNLLNNDYAIDLGPFGMLPPGNFQVCYGFNWHSVHGSVKIAEECIDLEVEPLMPPQLTYPYDEAVMESPYPQFTWLPPGPLQSYSGLSYDFKLVEILPSQTAVDAIQTNMPVLYQSGISALNYLYHSGLPQLKYDQPYAWKIVARNNSVQIAETETWTFTVRLFGHADSVFVGDPPFVKMRKDDNGGYAINGSILKFDYYNEYSDTVWNVRCFDIGKSVREEIFINMDSLPIIPGQNLVSVTISDATGFKHKHLYQLEILNSRQEVWRLKFEYRKPEEN